VKTPAVIIKSPVPLNPTERVESVPIPPIVRVPARIIDPASPWKFPTVVSEIVEVWAVRMEDEASASTRVRVDGPLKVRLELLVALTSVRVAPPL